MKRHMKIILPIGFLLALSYTFVFFNINSRPSQIIKTSCQKTGDDFILYFKHSKFTSKKKFNVMNLRPGMITIKTKPKIINLEFVTDDDIIIKANKVNDNVFQKPLKTDLLVSSIRLFPKSWSINRIDIIISRKPFFSVFFILFQLVSLFILFCIGLLTIYFLFTSIITGESIKNFSCRILFGITTIGGLALLWALCQLPLLHHLTKDGSIDTQRILSSGLVYSLLLNTVIWIPPLWRNHRPQLLLTFVTLLGCLMLVHIVSPYIIPQVALPKYKSFFSPDLHHVLPPKTRMFAGKYDGLNVIIQTNEDGLRTNYSMIQFTSLGPRIIVMGDSFTYGLGVRQNKVWPQLLEDRLRLRFQRNDIGVLNAGIISYSPILQARQFDAILRHYKPDLVILLLDPTDIGDDYNYAAEFKTLHPPVAMNPLKKMPSGILHMSQGVREYIQSALSFPFDFACTTISNRSASPTDIENYDYYKFHLEIGGSVESNRFFIYRHPLDDTLPYFNFTYSNIAHIARATQGLGADFILAPSPRFHHWNRKECPANWEASSYRLDEPYQFEFFRYFSERAGSGQIEVLDLLGAFQATTNFPLVFNSDPHWNEAGNSFVANVIEEYIVTHHATLFANPQRIEKEPNKRPQK